MQRSSPTSAEFPRTANFQRLTEGKLTLYVLPFKPFDLSVSMSFRVPKLALLALSLSAASSAHAAGMSAAAEPLFHVGPLPITNSMVTSWVVAAVIILVIRIAIGRPQLVPSHGQAIVETLVEGVYDLITPIVGKRVAPHAFPLLVALFTFILLQNWSGLFPGVGTVFMRDHATGEWMEFVRPGNADLNGTLALAIAATIGWLYLILRYAGWRAVVKDIFGNKANRSEVPAVIYFPLFILFFAVGLIEIVSIIFRPISLSFRLFGNVFGGENLLHAMSGIQKWLLPVPFYFLEVLIGFVQALVFVLLVSVYIGLICNHGDETHSHEAEATH